jgi:hypothetical protein
VSVVSWMALKNFTLAEFAKLEQDCFAKNSIWALALQRPVDIPDAVLQPAAAPAVSHAVWCRLSPSLSCQLPLVMSPVVSSHLPLVMSSRA